jgi:dUTP pyrophosphatase
MITVKVKKLDPEAKMPEYAHPGDAGMDLFALEATEVPVKGVARIRTGLAFEIPEGYVGLCWDKSGLAVNHGIKTMAGVLDAGFRGELVLVAANLRDEPHLFEKGHKVMQMLIQKVELPVIEEAVELSETTRGEGKFGSTGK